jgi:monovalent cation/hydrogen antiporter
LARSPERRLAYFGVGVAVLVTVIVVRIAWVMSYNTAARWRIPQFGFHPRRPMMAPTVKGGNAYSDLRSSLLLGK